MLFVFRTRSHRGPRLWALDGSALSDDTSPAPEKQNFTFYTKKFRAGRLQKSGLAGSRGARSALLYGIKPDL